MPDRTGRPQPQNINIVGNTVHGDIVYGNKHPAPRTIPATNPARCTTILLLAANPTDTPQLRLEEEMREIDLGIRQAEFRDSFNISHQGALRARDLQPLLLRHQPRIVHFSGHGARNGRLILEDDEGKRRPVPPEALADLFSLFSTTIRCVVLNACFSSEQASAISESVDFVIGMTEPIGDRSAVDFARAVYRGFAAGCDIQRAFDLGRIEVGLDENAQGVPRLLTRKGANPNRMTFI